MEQWLPTPLAIPATMTIVIGLLASFGVFSVTEAIFQPYDLNKAFAESDDPVTRGDEQQDQTRTENSKTVDDFAAGYENSFLILNVLANDRKEMHGYDNAISIQSVSKPSFGTVMVNSDNTITYTPNGQRLPAGAIVSDSFNYFAVLHNADEDISPQQYYDATVRVQITQVNDAPFTFDTDYTISHGGILSSYVPAYDQDGDRLIFSIVSRPKLGEIVYFDPGTGRFRYAPYNNSAGYDSFTYMTSDGVSTSPVAAVKITVLESLDNNSEDDSFGTGQQAIGDDDNDGYYDDYYYENDVDSSSNDTSSQSTSNGGEEHSGPIAEASTTSKEVLAGDQVVLDGLASYDPDGDAITYSWSQTTGPTISLSSSNSATPSFIAPSVNSMTTLTFQLIVRDAEATSDPSVISITILPIPIMQIDVLPGIYPNEINTNKDKESIPVAILGSNSVDVSIIVQSSLEFGPNSATATSFEMEDSNGDGFTDLVSYFSAEDLGLKSSDTETCMTGSLITSSTTLPFDACDSVKVVNKNAS